MQSARLFSTQSENRLLKGVLPILLFGLALTASLAAPVFAQDKITVGTATSADNAFPFGTTPPGDFPSYAAGGDYQEIYSSAAFGITTPINISSIAFASSTRGMKPVTATYNVTIGLSNTSATVGPGSNASSNFAQNKGANFTTVFNGPLTAVLQNNNTFDLVFPTSPFLYDPSKGNLLFDVVFNNAAQATGSADFLTDNGFQTERVYESFGQGTSGFVGNGALYTQFTASPAAVPEASTTISLGLLLALGLGGVFATHRKQAAR